ncbi:MAG: hypothetical protein KatS3mg016_1256 [Fimbriimonadales bacterium]|nr:MAG: hypothetical protein KatS3mg016_1256 [Fimbriimonadales bacterium]
MRRAVLYEQSHLLLSNALLAAKRYPGLTGNRLQNIAHRFQLEPNGYGLLQEWAFGQAHRLSIGRA